MTVFEMLGTLLIGPLKLIFEIIYSVANRLIGHPGLAIICLSLVMNILVLPLYRRADAMQEEARDIDAKLRDGVAHIKKSFTGDERMMILQTYYRQNNYKPTDALNGSVSLLLEVPFFMAAYQFLSNLEILEGVPLGPITDLGAPDGLIVIGGIAINLLPILMTLINVISSALYLKGFPLKTKIQLYGMALFFLVFLYTSPACLVFYWTLNNVFSLVKTIFYKLKNPKKVLIALTSLVGVLLFVFVAFFYTYGSPRRKLFLCAVGVVLLMPLAISLLSKALAGKVKLAPPKPNRKVFILGALLLTVLVGLLVPSTLIAASPQEFVDVNLFYNPLWHVVSALCLSAGTFLVWMGVFYWLAAPRGKAIFEKLVWILCGAMLVNYMFFGTNLGVLSAKLQFENDLIFAPKEQLINLAVMALLAVVLFVCIKKWERIVPTVLLIAVVALGGMSVLNLTAINRSINEYLASPAAQNNENATFRLSKTGKNVVVVMLDRAMGQQVPYIFEERPELKEQFDGFTYYENTISFGAYTNFGTPALFGGYEYTPVELNKRSTEALVDKHNEALLVMPVLFDENGFEVTVCDPPYANYQWIPDLSIYDAYPDINTYITKGKITDTSKKEQEIAVMPRNLFCYSAMKCMPVILQPFVYDNGAYNQISVQSQASGELSSAAGINTIFENSYNVLTALPEMTGITKEQVDTLLVMTNDTTHEATLLQTPDYTPAQTVNNTQYDAEHADRFLYNGRYLRTENYLQMSHYHVNMASYIQLGKWFDYMRENGVYDNTKIILVSDHGRDLYQLDELVMDDGTDGLMDMEYYYPLLMVKDYNSEGFTISDEFMTNADVPVIAVRDTIETPVNPFTGNELTAEEKTAHDQFIIMSYDYQTDVNNGNMFLPAKWASIHDSIWNRDNWTILQEESVLTEHAMP